MKGDYLTEEKVILWNTKYGDIHCKLKDVMQRKGVNLFQLERITGIKYDVLKRYYTDNLTRYDSSVLAKICYSLECPLNELLVYEVRK